MTTVNNDIITKETGWHLPTAVAQYNEYGAVNTTICYAYSNLIYLKQRDNTVASIDGEGGVNHLTRSPIVYTYGYNFKIPENATITRIQVRQRRKCNTTTTKSEQGIKDVVMRLKIGANITNYGAGTNNADDAKWSSKELGLTDYTYGNTKETVYEQWGLTVTPAMANNPNFGAVTQCIGLTEEIMQPVIDSIEINITYTQMGTTNTTPTSTSETVKENPNQDVQLTSEVNTYYQPDGQEEPTHQMKTEEFVDYIYTPISFWIRYKNNVQRNTFGVDYIERGKHDQITITVNECLRFNDGSNVLKLPVTVIEESMDKEDILRGYKSILRQVTVYPKQVGTGVITIKGLVPSNKNNNTTTQTLNITIRESFLNTSNSSTTIYNSTFKNCSATKGSAIFNDGKLTYEHLTLSDITNQNKVLWDYDKYRDGEFR